MRSDKDAGSAQWPYIRVLPCNYNVALPNAALLRTTDKPYSASSQEGRRWVDQPQSALVLDDAMYASAREQWHQSNGHASTSGQQGDYYGLLGVPKVSWGSPFLEPSWTSAALLYACCCQGWVYCSASSTMLTAALLLCCQMRCNVTSDCSLTSQIIAHCCRMPRQRRSSGHTMCWQGSCTQTRTVAMSRLIRGSNSLARHTRYMFCALIPRASSAGLLRLLAE